MKGLPVFAHLTAIINYLNQTRANRILHEDKQKRISLIWDEIISLKWTLKHGANHVHAGFYSALGYN